jgi:hypothetical protein
MARLEADQMVAEAAEAANTTPTSADFALADRIDGLV